MNNKCRTFRTMLMMIATLAFLLQGGSYHPAEIGASGNIHVKAASLAENASGNIHVKAASLAENASGNTNVEAVSLSEKDPLALSQSRAVNQTGSTNQFATVNQTGSTNQYATVNQPKSFDQFGAQNQSGLPDQSGAVNQTRVISQSKAVNSMKTHIPMLVCQYFDEPSFSNAISASVFFDEETLNLKGGIVPHHLLASGMIASFWKTVSQNHYDLVILIGPDHHQKGNSEITTITSGFSTIYGDVLVEKPIVDTLINENLASEDRQVMETDHAISSQVPFIKYYMPETPILPLLVYGSCRYEKTRAIADRITALTQDRSVLFVASIDFSHYLPLDVANRMDAYTEQVLADFDYDRITKMTNDHLDSRPSALFLLQAMAGIGAKSMVRWDRSNSDMISNQDTGNTTSYFTFGFFDEGKPDRENAQEGVNNEDEINKKNRINAKTKDGVDNGDGANANTKEETNNGDGANANTKEETNNEDGANTNTKKKLNASAERPMNTEEVLEEQSKTQEWPNRVQLIDNRSDSLTENMKEFDESLETHIVAVGDIMLGRGVAKNLKTHNLGYLYPFIEVKEFLDRGDIVFGNLEHPITDRENSLDRRFKYVLKAGAEVMPGLTFAGFNLVSLANNHIMDYYEGGLEDTLRFLDERNIEHAGAGPNLDEARKPAIIEKNGIKFGLLAYTDMADVTWKGNPPIKFGAQAYHPGVAPLRPALIEEDIQNVRDQVDILLISLHWGVEGSDAVTCEQKKLAHKLCDLGADVILGHHPHRFQGIEIFQGKPILYSLGNLIFDQADLKNQESFIVELTYEGETFIGLKAIPVRTVNKAQVIQQKGTEADELLQRQLQLCKELGTEGIVKDSCLFISTEQVNRQKGDRGDR